MILHMILPEECVLLPEQKLPETHCRPHGAAYLEFQSDGTLETLCRVISTNPKDYLNPDLAPGARQRYKNREKTFEDYTSFRI